MSRVPTTAKTMRIRSPALSLNSSSKKEKKRSWLSIVMHTLLGLSFVVSMIVLGLEGEKYIDAQRASKLTSSNKQQAEPKSQQKPPPLPISPPITTTVAVTSIVKEVASATIAPTTISNNEKVLQATFDQNLKTFLKAQEKPPVEDINQGKDLDYGPNIHKIVHASSPWKTGVRQDLRVNIPRYIDTGSQSELAARASRRAAAATATASLYPNNGSSVYPSRALREARAVLDKHPLFSSAYTKLLENTYNESTACLQTASNHIVHGHSGR